MIGHGADAFPFVLSGASSYLNHPHNFPLQFLNSWGLLGGGALMLALAVIGHRLLKRGDKADGLTVCGAEDQVFLSVSAAHGYEFVPFADGHGYDTVCAWVLVVFECGFFLGEAGEEFFLLPLEVFYLGVGGFN